MKKPYKYIIVFLLTIFTLAGCGKEQNNSPREEGKLLIYSTVYPLQDFAEKIGGDYVEVRTVYPPGADEHTYEPSQKEIIEMAGSDLFFYIGLGLEGFVENIKPILSDEGVSVVPVGERMDLYATDSDSHNEDDHADTEENHDHGNQVPEESGEHQHGNVNPHIWLDPIYAEQIAHTILEELINALPDQKQYFEANFEDMHGNFDSLHQKFTEVSSKAVIKSFIVSHSAYDYWETRYGLKQLSVAGMSTSEEPSQKQLMEIIDEVKEKKLKYILVEQNVNNKLVDVIQDEANVSAIPIHNLSVLTEADIKASEDYFSIMNRNIKSLKKALDVE